MQSDWRYKMLTVVQYTNFINLCNYVNNIIHHMELDWGPEVPPALEECQEV